MTPTLPQRLEGGLLGLLIGDALGVPYEFHPPHALPPPEAIEFEPPRGFPRAHAGVPPGTWSDDGAQALVLLHSLLANDGLDLRHFADGLVRWRREGFCAVEATCSTSACRPAPRWTGSKPACRPTAPARPASATTAAAR